MHKVEQFSKYDVTKMSKCNIFCVITKTFAYTFNHHSYLIYTYVILPEVRKLHRKNNWISSFMDSMANPDFLNGKKVNRYYQQIGRKILISEVHKNMSKMSHCQNIIRQSHKNVKIGIFQLSMGLFLINGRKHLLYVALKDS